MTQRSTAGKHRQSSTSTSMHGAKSRIAVVTLAAGAVSGAGATGAAAASIAAPAEQPQVQSANADIALANDAELVDDSAAAALEQAAPQILSIAEYKPVTGLTDQLDKAVDAAEQRIALEASQRGPGVVKPAEGAYTSGFGMRWGSMHAGIDLAAPIGTPILAAMDGTVIDSGPASGYGNWIRIQHDDGSITVYGHMSTLNVAVGQRVTAGQHIAGMGSEGFSTGSHLHFEIHPGGGGAIDPIPWLAERGVVIA